MGTPKLEITESNNRDGLDEGSKYKGIARHPLARRWLRRCYAEARKAGDVAKGLKTRAKMKRLGMEVRDEKG